MRLSPRIIGNTEDALREVLRLDAPADSTLSHFFRRHPKLGSRERGVIAEAVYTVLRNRRFYVEFACGGSTPTMRQMALLGLSDSVGVESLGLSAEELDWLAGVMSTDRALLPPAIYANLPQWLFDKLVEQYGEAETMALAQALNQPAPLDLRVNSLKASREDVINELAAAPIQCEAMPFSSLGLRVKKKPALHNLPLFKSGAIEVQDEGSQLLSQIVGAKRGEMVADFCAGAGGKTLALGAAMRNTGRLYAFDISEKRLSRLKPRLARSGLSNVHPVRIAHENDARIKRLAGKVDRVLVDAPCSGLGTLRRNPDMKWRQSLDAIDELQQKQQAILSSAARMVKPGGRLVYATCSLLKEENESVVAQFLSSHDQFSLVPMKQVLAEQKVPLDMDDYLKLLPHVHHTDGFFAAVFERKSAEKKAEK